MANHEDKVFATVKKYFDRGNAHLDNGDLDRAFADFNEAIKLDPKNVLARKALANLKSKLKS